MREKRRMKMVDITKTDLFKSFVKNLKECYVDVKEAIDKYMDLEDKDLEKITLWCLSAKVVQPHAPVFPFLFINASKGSGKTRLLKLLAFLLDGKVVINPTETILFRTNFPLFFDELEQIAGKNKKDLRELFNSAYKRGGKVYRSVKVEEIDKGKKITTFKVVDFSVYKPIAMANIWGMHDVLGDRCLSVILEKSNSYKTKLCEDFETDEVCIRAKKRLNELLGNDEVSVESVVSVVKKVYREWNKYVLKNYKSINTYTTYNTHTTHNTYTTHNTLTTLEKNYKSINTHTTHNTYTTHNTLTTLDEFSLSKVYDKIYKSNFFSREFELTFPLLLITALMDKIDGTDLFTLTDKMIEIFKQEIKDKYREEIMESDDTILLDFVSRLDENLGMEYVPINEIFKQFKEFREDSEHIPDWLNIRWFGRALKRLKLVIDKRRIGRGIEIRLNVKKAKKRIGMYKKNGVTNK